MGVLILHRLVIRVEQYSYILLVSLFLTLGLHFLNKGSETPNLHFLEYFACFLKIRVVVISL